MKFIFDLDGTITEKETLPVIAEYFNIENEIKKMTEMTVKGDIPFIESFIKRVQILGKFSVEKISNLLSDIPLDSKIVDFIYNNKENCIVATGNFEGWIDKLAEKIGCAFFSSEGFVNKNNHVSLTKILKKEDVVSYFQSIGEFVIYIGDGNNDSEAMRRANISIACGTVHYPANSVLASADFAVFDSNALVRLLNQIITDMPGYSVVISCAGVGSRLGLGQTKSLIRFYGKPLIHYQLEYFIEVNDLRIVVGYQAKDMIESVLLKRKDVIFVFNHDYFHTNTGTSLYLGSRYANEYVIAWDGDLLVHPDDIRKCLAKKSEYIGCCVPTTEDAVYVRTNEKNLVTAFSRESGDFEWSGPACIKRNSIRYISGYVYSIIEQILPIPILKITAQDIDTYGDYENALKFIRDYYLGNNAIDCYYNALAEKISSPLETRNQARDSSYYDISLVKRFSGDKLSLLDLGAGTGLLVNKLIDSFRSITVLEKQKKFSHFIINSEKITIINGDLLEFSFLEKYDIVTMFGLMNYFNSSESEYIYRKIFNDALKKGGKLIVKHQMGIEEDVVVNGYSEELRTDYYSEYRSLNNEIKLIEQAGLTVIDTVDIYPPDYNRWPTTHFYALICEAA